MTSGRLWVFLILVLSLISCNHEEKTQLGDYGNCLVFVHRPSESIIARANDYTPNTVDTACADLHVYVMSSLKELSGYQTPQYYSIKGDENIEQQIKAFLDPSNDIFSGDYPVIVEYRTELCKNICLKLYSSDNILLSDITDKAQFYYVRDPWDVSEVVQNILVNSEKKLLGRVKLGTTISEYLSYHPMIFAEAHFIFPDLEKETFDKGNYVKIEIELENNTILTGITNVSK